MLGNYLGWVRQNFWSRWENIFLRPGQFIRFGYGSDFDTYEEGAWTPTITASTTNPTVTYTHQTGGYTQIGNVVFYSLHVHIASISGGAGYVGITLPVTVGSKYHAAQVYYNGIDLPAGTIDVLFRTTPSASEGRLAVCYDNAAAGLLDISALAATDWMRIDGFYFA